MQRENSMESKMKQPQKIVTKKSVFHSLDTPYAIDWPTIAKEDADSVLETVVRKVKELKVGLMLREKVRIRSKGKQPLPAKKKELIKSKMKEWWDRGKENRSHLALGLNDVTRCLENDLLCAALFCRDAKPSLITSFLLPLCSTRAVCAAALPSLSAKMCEALNFKTCLAIGFKKSVRDSENPFYNCFKVIEKVIPRLSPLLLNISIASVESESVSTVGKDVMPKEGCYQQQLKLESIDQEQEEGNGSKEEETADEDYSYLYLKKTEPEVQAKTYENLGEFIALASSSESEEEDIIKEKRIREKRKNEFSEPNAKRKKTDKGMIKKKKSKKDKFARAAVSYKPLSIKTLQPNANKKNKKNKRFLL